MPDTFWQQEAERLTQRVLELEEDLKRSDDLIKSFLIDQAKRTVIVKAMIPGDEIVGDLNTWLTQRGFNLDNGQIYAWNRDKETGTQTFTQAQTAECEEDSKSVWHFNVASIEPQPTLSLEQFNALMRQSHIKASQEGQAILLGLESQSQIRAEELKLQHAQVKAEIAKLNRITDELEQETKPE